MPSTFKTRSQLAAEYGIDRKTLIKKLNQLNIPIDTGALSPITVDIIYNTLGNPHTPLPNMPQKYPKSHTLLSK